MKTNINLDTIITGDNCEVMRGMPDKCIDLVVTSPPYDDLRTYGGHDWDFEGVATKLTRLLKPGGVIVWVVNDATVNGGETGSSFRQAIQFQTLGLNIHDTMIWNKGSFTGVGSLAVRYAPTWEYMFILSKGKPKTFNPIKDRKNKVSGKIGGKLRLPDGGMKQMSTHGKDRAEYGQRFGIWDQPPAGGNKTGHPAVFPKQLAADHITSWSNPGDVVLDPFAGSGTTLKAAKELNRHYIGIEVNPKYVEICKKRTAQESLALDI